MTDRNARILARFDVAMTQLGLDVSLPPYVPITATEQERADRMIERIKADRDYAGLATDRDMDRAADDYFQPKDY